MDAFQSFGFNGSLWIGAGIQAISDEFQKPSLSSKGQGKNCLSKASFICMRISLYTDVYRLAVNKSPVVYNLSPALDGL